MRACMSVSIFFSVFNYVANVRYMCVNILYDISFVLITENIADTHDWRINVSFTLYVSVHEIVVLIASASSEGSGKYMRRLAGVFAARILKVLKVCVNMKTETLS